MQGLRDKTRNFFKREISARMEFRRQLKLLIIIALGFTIAFSWRQTIFDSVQFLVLLFTNIENLATASIVTSLIITLISLIFVYITSQLLQVPPEYR